jgi:hypothetical protein
MLNHRYRILLAGALLIILLIVVGVLIVGFAGRNDERPSEIPTNATSTSTYSARATPGLTIHGIVRDENGIGLEHVLIYRNYASYPGEVIATTDSSGYYESIFYAIPGDEMIGLWAEKPGYTFDPPQYQWRHYYGNELAERDFLGRQP